MKDETVEKLRYPIGKFQWKAEMTQESFQHHKQKIAHYPQDLDKTINGFTEDDLKKPYRPGGWQIAQLIHHIADSHTHNYIRFKQALLEDTPTIMDYKPDDWASTPDALTLDIAGSLQIIKGIHQRWATLLNSVKLEDLQRSYYHPNRDKYYPLHIALALYSWHGDHHLAHIKNAP